jgi:hypothetical protein
MHADLRFQTGKIIRSPAGPDVVERLPKKNVESGLEVMNKGMSNRRVVDEFTRHE